MATFYESVLHERCRTVPYHFSFNSSSSSFYFVHKFLGISDEMCGSHLVYMVTLIITQMHSQETTTCAQLFISVDINFARRQQIKLMYKGNKILASRVTPRFHLNGYYLVHQTREQASYFPIISLPIYTHTDLASHNSRQLQILHASCHDCYRMEMDWPESDA
jgi:hypothetical protein